MRKLGGFDVDLPGFSNFYENRNVRSAKDRYDFLVNSFLPIPDVTDYLNRVKYIGRYLDNLEDVANRATTLTSATCPRRMSQVPCEYCILLYSIISLSNTYPMQRYTYITYCIENQHIFKANKTLQTIAQ